MKRFWTVVMISFAINAYADDQPNNDNQDSASQGVKQYDWQSCLDDKMSDCMNSCETSEDPNCKDGCSAMANDKCQSEGLQPPPQ